MSVSLDFLASVIPAKAGIHHCHQNYDNIDPGVSTCDGSRLSPG
jgi:hypothetical protein